MMLFRKEWAVGAAGEVLAGREEMVSGVEGDIRQDQGVGQGVYLDQGWACLLV